MDGANVEIVEEVGAENAFIFGLSADEVMRYEREGGYNPWDIYNSNQNVRRVLTQLINGQYSEDTELFRDLYDSLTKEDVYFILKDFDSYADAQRRVDEAYRDEAGWARMAMMNTACAGKFSSDRTIEEYVKDIWHLEKVKVKK
jgi:starch phosphorylase